MDKALAKEYTLSLFLSIADNHKQIAGFLARTGIHADDIRHHIHSSAFLGAFLDYLMAYEPALLEACEKANVNPQDILSIRKSLGSFDIMH